MSYGGACPNKVKDMIEQHPELRWFAILLAFICGISLIALCENARMLSVSDEENKPMISDEGITKNVQTGNYFVSVQNQTDLNVTTKWKGKVMNLLDFKRATDGPSMNVYSVKDEDGDPCILLRAIAYVSFSYTTRLGDRQERFSFIPKNTNVDGDCSSEEVGSMIFNWDEDMHLVIEFVKTSGGENWYIGRVNFSCTTKHPEIFGQMVFPMATINASHADDLLFLTTIGAAYRCDFSKRTQIPLHNPKYLDLQITLVLRDLTVQPFLVTHHFGPEIECVVSQMEMLVHELGSYMAAILYIGVQCSLLYWYQQELKRRAPELEKLMEIRDDRTTSYTAIH